MGLSKQQQPVLLLAFRQVLHWLHEVALQYTACHSHKVKLLVLPNVLLTMVLLLQELKGNIRVFCRVRPLVAHDALAQTAAVDQLLQFPSSGGVSHLLCHISTCTPADDFSTQVSCTECAP